MITIQQKKLKYFSWICKKVKTRKVVIFLFMSYIFPTRNYENFLSLSTPKTVYFCSWCVETSYANPASFDGFPAIASVTELFSIVVALACHLIRNLYFLVSLINFFDYSEGSKLTAFAPAFKWFFIRLFKCIWSHDKFVWLVNEWLFCHLCFIFWTLFRDSQIVWGTPSLAQSPNESLFSALFEINFLCLNEVLPALYSVRMPAHWFWQINL